MRSGVFMKTTFSRKEPIVVDLSLLANSALLEWLARAYHTTLVLPPRSTPLMTRLRRSFAIVAALATSAACLPAAAQAPRQPNILVIWGDDIGGFNISAYNQGMMGYRTPNIDSIAKDGALFTDWYGQQSCTAGRAAFITGQSPIRTGLTKVGLPGAPEGMRKEDPTIATTCCPRPMASTSSSATSITSTPRRNPSTLTTRRILSSRRSSARGA